MNPVACFRFNFCFLFLNFSFRGIDTSWELVFLSPGGSGSRGDSAAVPSPPRAVEASGPSYVKQTVVVVEF